MNQQVLQAFEQALAIAKAGKYHTNPNPMVGCILLDRNGQVVSQGYHRKLGDLHAESHALLQLPSGIDRSTLQAIVTLEPCSFQGKQPACCETLVEQGIKSVVVGAHDPNPKVSGKGMQYLKTHGVDAIYAQNLPDSWHKNHRFMNRGFFSAQQRKKPWITAKIGMSLDGKMALADGTSQWITSSSSRRFVQDERAQTDAIITGGETLRFDNPSMNVRPEQMFEKDQAIWNLYPRKQPELFVVSSKPTSQNKRFTLISAQNGLERAVSEYTSNYNRVLLEAGPGLIRAFEQSELIDEWIYFTSPHLLGKNAIGLGDTTKLTSLPDRTKDSRFLYETFPSGNDVVSRYINQQSWQDISP